MKWVIAIAIMLMALTACNTIQSQPTTQPAATEMPEVKIPNPASVYCEEKGNKLEIQTAADGSQSGVCIFPDGNSCDEWTYYRGECGPAAPVNPTAVITAEPASDVASGGAGNDGSGGYMPPESEEEFSDWWGIIKSTKPGAEFDDYFERQDLGQIIFFGIDSLLPEVRSQIETLRDSGKIVHLYGILLSNVPDYNGSQVQIERIEVDG